MNHLINLSFEKFNISVFKRRVARYHMISRSKVTARVTKGIDNYGQGCIFPYDRDFSGSVVDGLANFHALHNIFALKNQNIALTYK